ncbi:MAG: protein kinase [Polyangiaceae bacterium]|nr:protein kinase [Polyangiaceae bacterium]
MVLSPQQATGKKLGSYELLREVCASSVGATFVARNVSAEASSLVSLTKVHRHVAKSPQLCDAFLQAAKKASALTHATIDRVVDNGTIDGEPFVAHEHHDSETLATLLRRAGPEGLSLPIATRIMLDVLDAIRAAHAASSDFGHGEIGPWCVHIGQDGRTRMSGFGVDRALTRFGLHYAKNLDRLPYAAPERVKAMSLTLGPQPPQPDVRADVFSAAALGWELLTRQRLFASRMEAAVIQKVLASAIPEPKSQRPEIGDELSRTVVSALARDPGERTALDALIRAFETSEAASYDAVAEFASRQVDKSQARAVNAAAPRGFSSVRPPPMAPAVVGARSVKPAATPANGSGAVGEAGEAASLPTPADARMKSIPPVSPRAPVAGAPRTRAKTLMGFTSAPMTHASDKPVEEEDTTVNQAAGVPAAPRVPSINDESTSVDDFIVEEDDAPSPVSATIPRRPPARRPPPKPRQQTLLGIEPLAGDPKPTPAPPPVAPVAAAAPAVTPAPPPATPSPRPGAATLMGIPSLDLPAETPAPAAASPAPPIAKTQNGSAKPAAPKLGGVDRLGPGVSLGKAPHAYQLLAAVARGGMATVWAARPAGSAGIDDLIAVKTILPELSDDADFETMFVDEMRVAAKIRHPNVAQILSVGEEDGVMYLAMEWVDGETFGAIQESSRASGGVPLSILVRMASDVCAGLHAAHELRDEAGNLLDLVHRDINPSNVIVGQDGIAKVVDFGIAKSKGRVHVTRAGSTVKGKTPYLSPEQLGGMAIDRRADLFSLGALLYVMSTGVHPFRGESELKTIENIVIKSPAPLRSVVPDIHPDFDALVLRLLEKDPKKRPGSAEEVRGELERIAKLLERPASARDVGTFVERAVADVLGKRRRELLAASAKFAPAGAAAPTGAAGGIGEPFASLDEPTIADAPVAEVASSDIPVSDLGPSPLEPPDAFGDARGADAGALGDEAAEEEPRRISPWVRLVFLIVIGVAVGIGVIALIEAMRAPPPEPAKTAQPSVTATAPTPVTATETAIAAPPPTMTIDVQPTAEATATATESASAAASESATAEATASATATTAPTATARPPTTRPTTTGTGPRPKPTGTAKKPPKYNPSGI